VDFIIVEDDRPTCLIECKWGDGPVSPGLKYLRARFVDADAWQISATGKKDYVSTEGIRVCPALGFLKELA